MLSYIHVCRPTAQSFSCRFGALHNINYNATAHNRTTAFLSRQNLPLIPTQYISASPACIYRGNHFHIIIYVVEGVENLYYCFCPANKIRYNHCKWFTGLVCGDSPITEVENGIFPRRAELSLFNSSVTHHITSPR